MEPTMPLPYKTIRGFGLLEVLIAVVVFSIGLIGLAGMLVMSTQANHGAFIRTQATFLAQSMADRMSANPIGLWNNAYNGTYPVSVSTLTTCTAAAPCSPMNVATRDKQQWSLSLMEFLPDDANLDTTNINCASTDGATLKANVPSFDAKRAPFDGTCTINITWTERSLAIGGASGAQTFSWVFQP